MILPEVPLRVLSSIGSSTARAATTSRSIFGYFLIVREVLFVGARLVLYSP
jgi:hypothetical protein